MDGDLFENVPCVDSNISYTVWTQIFLIRIKKKKDAFSNLFGYLWTRPQNLDQ